MQKKKTRPSSPCSCSFSAFFHRHLFLRRRTKNTFWWLDQIQIYWQRVQNMYSSIRSTYLHLILRVETRRRRWRRWRKYANDAIDTFVHLLNECTRRSIISSDEKSSTSWNFFFLLDHDDSDTKRNHVDCCLYIVSRRGETTAIAIAAAIAVTPNTSRKRTRENERKEKKVKESKNG